MTDVTDEHWFLISLTSARCEVDGTVVTWPMDGGPAGMKAALRAHLEHHGTPREDES